MSDETQQQRMQKASQLRWDRKRRNFAQTKGSTTKMIKTENGTTLPATYKSGTYRLWTQRGGSSGNVSIHIALSESNRVKAQFSAHKQARSKCR